MAYPTQVTIASGRTVYEGDPDNDQGITSRQVQVQVTYSLERQDGDLLAVTERKAREVEAAQEAVWRQVRKEQTELRLGAGREPATVDGCGDDGDDDRGEDPWPPYGDNEVPSDQNEVPSDQDEEGDEGAADDGRVADDGRGMDAGPDGPGADCPDGGVHGPRALPVTKPQKLALAAQARRMGLSDQALAEEIRERFGKTSFTPRYAVDRLTKAECDALLRALAAREWEAVRTGERAQPAPA